MALKRKETGRESLSDKDWAEAMRQAIMQPEDRKPHGFYARRELQKMWGLKEAQTRKLIMIGVRSGTLEQRTVKLRGPRGILQVTPVYGMTGGQSGE